MLVYCWSTVFKNKLQCDANFKTYVCRSEGVVNNDIFWPGLFFLLMYTTTLVQIEICHNDFFIYIVPLELEGAKLPLYKVAV